MKMLDVKTLEPENPPVARSPAKQRDTIDEKLEVWAHEIPDLDIRTDVPRTPVGKISKKELQEEEAAKRARISRTEHSRPGK